MSEQEFRRMEIQFPAMFKAIRDRALDEAIAEIADINPYASMSNGSENMQEAALQAVRNLKST